MQKFLRHRLGNAACGNGCDDLLPDEGADAEEDAPDPLLHVQRGSGERHTTELNYDNLEGSCQMILMVIHWFTFIIVYLTDERYDPDDVVDWVGEDADEDVPLPVDLPRVDLVEEGH